MLDVIGQVKKNIPFVALQKLVTPVISFVITVYVIRTLSVRDYGIYNVLIAAMGYVGLISSLGLPSILQRYVPEFQQKGQTSLVHRLVSRGLLLRGITAIGVLGIVVGFWGPLSRLLQLQGLFDYFMIFALGGLFYFEAALLSTALSGLFLHRFHVVSQLVYVPFRGILLFILLQMGWGLRGLLVGEAIAYSLLAGLQVIFYYRAFRGGIREDVSHSARLPMRRLVKYGGLSYFNESGAMILNVAADNLIISAFLGPAAVGLYIFANKLVQMVEETIPVHIFREVIRTSFFSQYTRNDDPDELNFMFNFLTKLTAFFYVPVSVWFVILGGRFTTIFFGVKYADAYAILVIVAIFFALKSFEFSVGLTAMSIEKIHINLLAKIFAIYNLGVDLLVVSRYGIIGVALVTASAVFFKNIFIYFGVKRYTHLRFPWIRIYRMVFAVIPVGLLSYVFADTLQTVLTFILASIGFFLAYGLLTLFLRPFSAREINIVKKLVPFESCKCCISRYAAGSWSGKRLFRTEGEST